MSMDAEGHHVHDGRFKKVAIIAAVGIVLMAAGIVVGLLGRADSPSDTAAISEADAAGIAAWCKLRREWAKDVDAIAADILLTSVRPDQKDKADALQRQRTGICASYRQKIVELGQVLTTPAIVSVEQALVKEGKARANTMVQIANALTELDALESGTAERQTVTDRLATMRQTRELLADKLKTRIQEMQSATDREISNALQAIPDCKGIYRGPLTDKGTSDNPYVSWEEVDLRRQTATKRYDDAMMKLIPQEQHANQVYHELMQRYRSTLRTCAVKTLGKLSSPAEAGLQIRLKRSGQVQSLALKWMDVNNPKFLDCLLGTAATWRLPPPARAGDVVIVRLELSAL